MFLIELGVGLTCELIDISLVSAFVNLSSEVSTGHTATCLLIWRVQNSLWGFHLNQFPYAAFVHRDSLILLLKLADFCLSLLVFKSLLNCTRVNLFNLWLMLLLGYWLFINVLSTRNWYNISVRWGMLLHFNWLLCHGLHDLLLLNWVI